MNRRLFLKNVAGVAGTVAAAQAAQTQVVTARESADAIILNPTPLFDISPRLYMQFMEPLGTADSSVEASWDYNSDDWRTDFVECTKGLAPGVVRFGGLFSRYYKWREGVGTATKRPWMRNYVWGGKETNRVGTHEFVDFCRRVDAEPLYCVNFKGDGHQTYTRTREGDRTGDAREAAEWVSYANDPDHAERKSHGHAEPYKIQLWQLGNETSYSAGGFSKAQSIETTIEFSRAMRERDRSVELIGWGDSGWAGDLVRQAGEHINYVAIHMMGQSPLRKDTVLNGFTYQNTPERAWEELMELTPARIEKKLIALEAELDEQNSKHPIAITEGHLSLAPHNANPILTEWLTGVYHARALNLYQRHGGRIKICTAADFNGSRWTTNALMLQVPAGASYLLPAGAVMRLFNRYNGKQGIAVKSAPSNLDIAASRDGNKIFLHVGNMNYSRSIETSFAIEGMAITSAKVFEISPENPRQEISPRNQKVFDPVEHTIPPSEPLRWRFPARSVSAVELEGHFV